jgi:hypothetical protein
MGRVTATNMTYSTDARVVLRARSAVLGGSTSLPAFGQGFAGAQRPEKLAQRRGLCFGQGFAGAQRPEKLAQRPEKLAQRRGLYF